jgi:hypothetical protein
MELAIVLSVGVILVPLIWTFSASVTDQTTLGRWQLEAAEGVRTIAEELRLDARAGEPTADGVGFQVQGCEVRYRVLEGARLVRHAPADCGGSRGLSRFVESVGWSPGGVDVTFARTLRPHRIHRTTVFIPVEGR